MEHYHIVQIVGLYYVTFTVVEWLPVFIDEPACKTITYSFNFCTRSKCLGLNAYVTMPTYSHAILFDVEFIQERLSVLAGYFAKTHAERRWVHCDHSPNFSGLKHGW